MTSSLLSRLYTERRAVRSMPSTGSVQVTLAPTLYVQGRRPPAPRPAYSYTRSSHEPEQFCTQCQNVPPPDPSVTKLAAAKLSPGQVTPSMLIGPPDIAVATAPTVHISLNA